MKHNVTMHPAEYTAEVQQTKVGRTLVLTARNGQHNAEMHAIPPRGLPSERWQAWVATEFLGFLERNGFAFPSRGCSLERT